MALSNRYPASQRAAPVRQSKPRPLPKPYPVPDNDNTPGKSRPRPRPVPANDNNLIGRPRMPRALGIAVRGVARRSAYGIATEVIGDLLKQHLAPWIYANLQTMLLADWVMDFKCSSRGSPQWISGNFASCVVNQLGLTPYTSVAHWLAAGNQNAVHLNMLWRHQHPVVPSLPAWDLAINYSRAIGNQSQPDVDNVPWPEFWPVPAPEAWPVGLPRPVRQPNVRGEPNVLPSNNSSRTSEQPFPGSRTWGRPFQRVRRPPKGTKERKIRGQGLLKVFGKGLSTYSEVGDFIESLWDALPDYAKTKDAHLGDKMMDLYENINDLDIAKAVENLIKNEIEDRIVGKLIGRATDTFGSNLGNALVSGGRAGW